jgi:hypothetical protein
MDINLLTRVLLALFTDHRLWIAAGGALLFLLITSLVANTSGGMKLPKVSKEVKKKPKVSQRPRLSILNILKKKAPPPPESEDDEADDKQEDTKGAKGKKN